MSDITDYSAVQQILIFQFSHCGPVVTPTPQGQAENNYDWLSVQDTMDMIDEGLISFARVGTSNEHMHIGDATGRCYRCVATTGTYNGRKA